MVRRYMEKSLIMNGKKIILGLVLLLSLLCTLFACEKNENKIDENALIIKETDSEILFGNFYREADKWSHTYNPPSDAKSTLKKEAIKWLILDKDEKKKEMTLITKFAIDVCVVEEGKLKSDLNWKNSNLREYINASLFDELFDESDKKSIVEVSIKDKQRNNINSTIETKDKMYLLSDEEVIKYALGQVSATDYAIDKGAARFLNSSNAWWLRTSAVHSDRLCFVDQNGKINYDGAKENAHNTIRPVIRVKFGYESGKKEDITSVSADKSLEIENVEGGVPVGIVGYEIDFGTYRFLDKDKESIKWIVLDKDEKENKALVISKYALDARRFDSSDKNKSTWDNSELRQWLNSEFLNTAFNEDEKKYIFDTKVLSEDNMEMGTYDGEDTIDKVFLLSLNEAKKYLSGVKTYCLPGFITDKVNQRDGVSPFAAWWLRTPGSKSGRICTAGARFDNRNSFDTHGHSADQKTFVRPCMWIKYVDKKLTDVHDDKARLIVGDKDSTVKFGKYYMKARDEYTGESSGFEDISWIVKYKDEENKKALLVSEYCIDNMFYNDTYDMLTWENSYVREWLNYYFYNVAFNTEEKRMIAKTKLLNYNFYSIEDGGNDTEDNVFILSAEDMLEYFDNDKKAKVTYYAMFEKDAYYKSGEDDNGITGYYGNYLLRNPSDNGYLNKTIHSGGYVIDGFEDQMKGASLRPAIWVNYNDEKVNWDKDETKKEIIATSSDLNNINFVSGKIKNINSLDSSSYSDGMLIAKNEKIFKMGSYPQIYKIDDESMKEFHENPSKTPNMKYVTINDSIKWIVLDYDEKEGKALLFSEKILDGYPYSDSGLNDSWSDSKLRKFLNEEFYNKAFSNAEKNNILTTELKTVSSSSDDKQDESNDKIFILSDEDIKNYYPDWKSRIGKMTSYAAKSVPYDDGEKNTGSYWIRGRNQYVSGHNGNMYWEWFRKDISGVRPAMWVKVNKKADDILYKNFITFGRYESLINLMFDKGIDNYDDYPVTDKFKKENLGGLFKKYELNDDDHYSYSIFVDKDKQAIKIYEYYDESFYGDTKKVRELNLMYSLNSDKYIDDIYKP